MNGNWLAPKVAELLGCDVGMAILIAAEISRSDLAFDDIDDDPEVRRAFEDLARRIHARLSRGRGNPDAGSN